MILPLQTRVRASRTSHLCWKLDVVDSRMFRNISLKNTWNTIYGRQAVWAFHPIHTLIHTLSLSLILYVSISLTYTCTHARTNTHTHTHTHAHTHTDLSLHLEVDLEGLKER